MKCKFFLKLFLLGMVLSQSPSDISQAKRLAKQMNISKTEAREIAKKQGYSDSEINSIAKKSETSESNWEKSQMDLEQTISLPTLENVNVNDPKNDAAFEQDVNGNEGIQNTGEEVLEIVDETKLQIDSYRETEIAVPRYFGYDIFARDPALFQATSVGAVDPDYLIGPSDEIIVMLWGETQFRQVLRVDREGFVFIPEIGQVFVNGLNLSLLESKLFRVFSQSYASLNPNGQAPTTFLDISLGNLRPLRIQVLGEVAQPGAYTVSPSATLFSALYYFNGPTTLGSLRDIQLIRDGEKIVSIDFYDYLLTGKKPKDLKLQLDDVIYIPRRLKTVTIEGEINRAGIYELKSNETILDLLAIAGDLKVTAYLERSQIDRIVPFDKREELGMDRMYTDLNLEQIVTSKVEFPLQDGDRIKIFSILDLRQNVVDLRGAVTRPGSYDIGDSLKLSELIKKADGLLGDAFLERVDIVRIKPDFNEELIKLNLGKALEGSLTDNMLLQGMDRVRVYSTTEMVERTFASIIGHVKRPGRYRIQENMTLHDLIFKAGGFIDEEFLNRTYLDRADLVRSNEDNITRSIKSFNLGKLLEFPESADNLELRNNDLIRIYSKDLFIDNKSISINGVIQNPGSYLLKTNMSLKDLILEAGGLDEDVYRFRIEIARIDPQNNNLQEYAKLLTIDMDKNLSSASDFFLEPYDLITVRPDPYFTNQKQVKIEGAVLYPGSYTILSSSEKITDIIERAGGFRPNAYSFGSTFSRNARRIQLDIEKIVKNPRSPSNITVQNGDLINISYEPKIIQILGEVNVPGLYKYEPKKRVNDIINIAGGFSENAQKNNIYIQYPNGTSFKYHRWFKNKKVRDGSIITIGKEKEIEPIDRTEYAKEITSIIANLAQVLILISAVNQ